MHGSNGQRAGSGPVVALVVFSEVQGENAAWARCQSSSIGDATPAQKARQARRSAAMLVRIPTGPVRNPADGERVCVSGNAPCGWPAYTPAELSGAKL